MNETERRAFEQFLAAIPKRRMTRRDLLRRMGIGAGALSTTAILAACGIGGENQNGGSSGEEEDGFTTTERNGELNFANWPAYIDREKGESPTLNQFQEATDITVNYKTVINDNLAFFQTIREPLANGDATPWDIVVFTDWMVAKIISLGYFEKLDHSLLPNFEAHAGEIYKNPSYDPNAAHSVPWAGGVTGIAYNIELTGREITSVDELFNPEFKGKVGMFTEMRDTMHLVMLADGVLPQDATTADAEKAQQRLLEQRESGILRQYYGNDYLQPLANGDLALTIAWSGDVVGETFSDKSPVRFVIPDEGGMLWMDNMSIPQNAANPIDAHEMMNFVYQPAIAAQMAGWINFICPVPEAQELMRRSDDAYIRTAAESPLVFPTPEMESRVYNYKNLTEAEEEEWNALFDEVLQG